MKPYQLTRNKFLQPEELTRLNALLASETNARDALLIDLALATGARASELLAIKGQDLDREQRTVFIRGLKGSRDRELPLRADLFRRLLNLVAKDSDRLFPISYPRLVQVWNEWRPAKKSFHCLRHTCAIELYRRTNDVRVVAKVLGHVSLNSTMIYVDFVSDMGTLRKAMGL